MFMAKKKDWKAYNAALERRGSLTLFLDEEVIAAWHATSKTGMRGCPATYSDAAYAACYSFQMLYSMPLRQTRGFINSLMNLMNTGLEAPSIASLSERRSHVTVEPVSYDAAGPLTLILDATGFKTVGAGDWQVDKHGSAKTARRRYRKLHIGTDADTGQIVSFRVTDSSVADIKAMPGLIEDAIERRDLAELIADGAYDSNATYELVGDYHGAKTTVRLPWNAAKGNHADRDESRRVQNWLGRDGWRKRYDYGRRSRIEGTMSCLKRLAPRLATRNADAQEAELRTLIGMANKFAYEVARS